MCESSAMSYVTIFHRIYCAWVVNGFLGSSPSVHAGSAFNAFSSASLDYIVLFECVYLILKLKKTHAVLRLQLSTEVFSCGATLPFQQCVGRLVLWPVCMPQSGLESRHKVLLSCGVIPNDGGALCGFLVCLSPCFYCAFLVIFTVCLNNWHRVNWTAVLAMHSFFSG